MAVGIGQVVTTENSQIQWYDRAGNLQSDQSLSTFYNIAAGTPIGDSRVVYDSVNNRFVVESDQWERPPDPGGRIARR